jgi:hypothetical protein
MGTDFAVLQVHMILCFEREDLANRLENPEHLEQLSRDFGTVLDDPREFAKRTQEAAAAAA